VGPNPSAQLFADPARYPSSTSIGAQVLNPAFVCPKIGCRYSAFSLNIDAGFFAESAGVLPLGNQIAGPRRSHNSPPVSSSKRRWIKLRAFRIYSFIGTSAGPGVTSAGFPPAFTMSFNSLLGLK